MENYPIIPTKFEKAFLDCIATAKQNPSKFKFCCILFDKRGRVLTKTFQNEFKTHPTQTKFAKIAKEPFKIFLHAEINALVKCKKQPYGMFICRVDSDGNLVNSKPCPICQLAIDSKGLQICYFTTNLNTIEMLPCT